MSDPDPETIGKINLADWFELGGQQKLVYTPPKKPLPWKSWTLWFVLLCGVALLVKMSISLLKGTHK